MLVSAPSYHAHVYFRPGQEALIEPLHARALQELEGLATVYPIRYRPVGPHPLPMFEIEFRHEHREPVLAWVQAQHGEQPVLLHPETGDDRIDHDAHARWLGDRLELDLSRL